MFFIEYLKHPKTVGALAPSSKRLAKKIVEPIDFATAGCIVEYGPGTGVFTEKILSEKRSETVFIVIEQNESFHAKLEEKYGGIQNVHIINGDAAEVESYLRQYGQTRADYIVSSLPFTSLPKDVTKRIFTSTKSAVGTSGKFITFQYTLIKKKVFLQWFQIDDILFELGNFPPAFVLEMKNPS